MITSISLSLDY